MSVHFVDPVALIVPPSCIAGLSFEAEWENRAVGAELIRQAGTLLELPDTVIYAAQLCLHRFYAKIPMQEFPLVRIVLAALYLAAKAEEHPRSLHDVLQSVDRTLRLRQGHPDAQPPHMGSPRMLSWRSSIPVIERVILTVLGFDVSVSAPHQALARLTSSGNTPPPQTLRRAWAALQAGGLTSAPLLFGPKILAAAALWLAAHETAQDTAQVALGDDVAQDGPRAPGAAADATSAVCGDSGPVLGTPVPTWLLEDYSATAGTARDCGCVVLDADTLARAWPQQQQQRARTEVDAGPGAETRALLELLAALPSPTAAGDGASGRFEQSVRAAAAWLRASLKRSEPLAYHATSPADAVESPLISLDAADIAETDRAIARAQW